MKVNITSFLSHFLWTNNIDCLGTKCILHFLGAFPADLNPYFGQNKCSWLCNTDHETNQGNIELQLKYGTICYFFYSFGVKPEKYQLLWKTMVAYKGHAANKNIAANKM